MNQQTEEGNHEAESENDLKARFASEFISQLPKRERKTKPVFHEKLKSKDFKVNQYMIMPSIPPYSPVDEGPKTILESRLRKYPYVHKKLITVEDMKKPKISSLGVLPVRDSTEIQSLSVVLEGAALPVDSSGLKTIPRLYNTPASSFIMPDIQVGDIDSTKENINKNEKSKNSEDKKQEAQKKPAILPGLGTASAVKLSERTKPLLKVSYLQQRRKKSSSRPISKEAFRTSTAESVPSSLMSAELSIPDTYTIYDDNSDHCNEDDAIETYVGLVQETDRTEQSSGNTVKSVKELLEEAKLISIDNSELKYQQNLEAVDEQKLKGKADKNKKLPVQSTKTSKPVKKIGKNKSEDDKTLKSNEIEPVDIKRGERTVDEIIASLKDQTAFNQETEADRKIKEIMQRVISRTNIEVEETVDEMLKSERNEISSSVTNFDQEVVDSSPYLLMGDAKIKSDINDLPNAEVEVTILSSEIKKDEFYNSGTDNIDQSQTMLNQELTFTVTDLKEENDLHNEDHIQEENYIMAPDYEQAWEDLLLSPEATAEDLLNVKGEMKEFHERRILLDPDTGLKSNVLTPSVSFLSTWAPRSETDKTELKTTIEKPNHMSIHHFCNNTMEYQLPPELMHVGRKYHTPDRFSNILPKQPYRFKPNDINSPPECIEVTSDSTAKFDQAANRVVQAITDDPSTLSEWQKKADSLLGQQTILIAGRRMDLRSDESMVYWTPAPPRLSAAPKFVKEYLFPQYEVSEVDDFGRKKEVQEIGEENFSSDGENVQKLMSENKTVIERTIRKRHNSDVSVSNVTNRIDEFLQDKLTSIQKNDNKSVKYFNEKSEKDKYSIEDFTRRPQSAPYITSKADDALVIPQDFNTALHEITEQKKLLERAKQTLKSPYLVQLEENNNKEVQNLPIKCEIIEPEIISLSQKVKEKLTPAEEAIQEGRKYVILSKRKIQKKKKRTLDKAKINAAEQMLMSKTVRLIERRESMPKLHKLIERELRVSWQIRHHRHSLPDVLNFQDYKMRKRMPTEENEREWVRGIWNFWFDEVFPPTPPESDVDEPVKENIDDKEIVEKKEEKKKLKNEIVEEILSQDIEAIEPITNMPKNIEIYKALQEEITKLTKVIDVIKNPTAFDFCRRGALYRKIGQLKKAEADLDRAISIEPDLLDAYWHRHLLYILQDRKNSALEDLNYIMKRNKNHSGAYRSMAEIYKQQNDITMAIINYSSAIKFNPSDHEAFYQRAQLYEKRGDMLLAMEDYTNAMKIMPYRTDAIMKHGMYYFENENWSNAIHDFTELLKVEPLNAKARLLRGRANAKMNNWVQALEDFSAAIHLDPVNWQAFYQRACILRKAHPDKALLDLSVSLLLNDTEENLMAYLQRGILYNTLGKPEDAIPDFESVLKLNKDIAPAHVNLGLIFMTRHLNYHRAIKKFTSAIKVDPTYVRAYVCRAEAYHKIHELKNALKDFTRAIHLHPDVHHYYMYRGQLILKLGNLDLAAYCVSHASELGVNNTNNSIGVSPNQQAVVQSFLKNYDKAVDALQQVTRTKPTAATFILLGKTNMKAKQYQEAVTSFSKALDKMKPWKKGDPWPKEAAEVHYLSGLCHMEIRNYSEAQIQFNQAIKLNTSYADAYYQRGLASVKLRHAKGIQDFNKALALNPKIFQAYLSRACYYGQKGKYAKAILNCNEAIKIQPKSVRGYLYRGALKYWIKAYALAILDLTKAASLDTECPIPYFNRAVCYHESGHYEKAITDYSIVLMLGNMLDLKVFINRGLLYFEKQDYMNALHDFKAAAKLHPADHRILHTLGLCYH
ncbi:hypothetical protein Btru_066421, partial [Bulinus truncatus]